jgi:hypothetical protein
MSVRFKLNRDKLASIRQRQAALAAAKADNCNDFFAECCGCCRKDCIYSYSCTYDCEEMEWGPIVQSNKECDNCHNRNHDWEYVEGTYYTYTMVVCIPDCTSPGDCNMADPPKPDFTPPCRVCKFTYSSVYDCDDGMWSTPNYSADCVEPDDCTDKPWTLNEDGLSAERIICDLECSSPGDCNPVPDAGLPGFTPECRICKWTFSSTYDCDGGMWTEPNGSPDCVHPYECQNTGWVVSDLSASITICGDACVSPGDCNPAPNPGLPGETPPCMVCRYSWESHYDCVEDDWTPPVLFSSDCQSEDCNETEWVISNNSASRTTCGGQCSEASECDPGTGPEKPSADPDPPCNKCEFRYTTSWSCQYRQWEEVNKSSYCTAPGECTAKDWEITPSSDDGYGNPISYQAEKIVCSNTTCIQESDCQAPDDIPTNTPECPCDECLADVEDWCGQCVGGTANQYQINFSAVGGYGCSYSLAVGPPPYYVWKMSVDSTSFGVSPDPDYPDDKCRFVKKWFGGGPISVKRCEGDGTGCGACEPQDEVVVETTAIFSPGNNSLYFEIKMENSNDVFLVLIAGYENVDFAGCCEVSEADIVEPNEFSGWFEIYGPGHVIASPC